MAENPTPAPTPKADRQPERQPEREPEREPERQPAPAPRAETGGPAGELSDWDLLHPPMDASVPNPMPASSERLHEAAIEDPELVPGLGLDDKVMLGGVTASTVTANLKTGPAQEAPRVVYDDAAAGRDEFVFDAGGQRARRASQEADADAQRAAQDRRARQAADDERRAPQGRSSQSELGSAQPPGAADQATPARRG